MPDIQIPSRINYGFARDHLENGGRYRAAYRYIDEGEYWHSLHCNSILRHNDSLFLTQVLINWYGSEYTESNGLELAVFDTTNETIVWANGPSNPVPTDPVNFTGEQKEMVNLKIRRESGRVMMYIDAKGLHDVLDAVGAQTNSSGKQYINRPTTCAAINARNSVLGTDVFLIRDYPYKVDLSAHFNDPVGFSALKKLSESSDSMVRSILEHYQPIDICVDIQKKMVK